MFRRLSAPQVHSQTRKVWFSLILDVERWSELFEKAAAGVWEAMSALPLAVSLQISNQPQ